MKKGLSYFLLIILCSTGSFSFAQVAGQEPKRKYDQGDKFIEVLNLIRTYYTDTVNEEPYKLALRNRSLKSCGTEAGGNIFS